ncbi:hypothetical protein BSL78_06258 [Apostichopus japonicus]|uniref:Uronyl 2-sulfotransferase n=1 Tax=Stichopus japonicus TaxID=307972 RepID=A0A2G8L9H7_STIJA|nr:hypothetical protein BSL78_06258 [Apostichopus japonicus]
MNPVTKNSGMSFALVVVVSAALILLFRTLTDGRSTTTLGTNYPQLTYVPHHRMSSASQDRNQTSKPSDNRLINCHVFHHTNSCNNLPNYFMYSSKRPQYKDAFINFMHVPKSGGTTMKECMNMVASNLVRDEPFLLHTEGRIQVTQDILNGDFRILNSTSLFMGDYSFGFCDLIHGIIGDRKCSTFVILREPYDRMVSNYYYCIELNQTIEGIPDCRTHTITEWALSTKSILWNEFFTDIDCTRSESWNCAIDYSPLASEAYVLSQNRSFVKSVVSNLDKHFSVVGLMEDFSTTLRMLQVAYKLPFFKYCNKFDYNVGQYDNSDSQLSKIQTRKKAKTDLINNPEIKKMLLPEILIYQRAKQIFELKRRN